MPSVYIPTQRTDTLTNSPIDAGVSVTNLMLLVEGIVYANGYRINYAGGFRSIFPVYNPGSNTVSLVCHNVAYGEDLPELLISNIEILINGS